MTRIVEPIATFIQAKDVKGIRPVPEPGLSQRGPSCGMYALAYVMRYWQMEANEWAFNSPSKRALPPARAHLAVPQAKMSAEQKAEKARLAEQGHFSSLRQYAKVHKLTQIGSLFEADHLLAIARGAGSQYHGSFDGSVLRCRTDTFEAMTKAFLDLGVPLIVPFDVKPQVGTPDTNSGGTAHWVAFTGYFMDNDVMYAVYYNWGGFYFAPVADFAKSNAQLTSNATKKFTKIRVTKQSGAVLRSDYTADAAIPAWEKPGDTVARGAVVQNIEFNDRSGSSSVGGLRFRTVVVHRVEDGEELKPLVEKYH